MAEYYTICRNSDENDDVKKSNLEYRNFKYTLSDNTLNITFDMFFKKQCTSTEVEKHYTLDCENIPNIKRIVELILSSENKDIMKVRLLDLLLEGNNE